MGLISLLSLTHFHNGDSMKTERDYLIENLEIIGDEYELNDWLESMLYKMKVKELKELEAGQLIELYDATLRKIYQ